MSKHHETAENVAKKIELALDSADLSAFAELLDENVTWDAPDGPPTCHNRQQVLAWYRREHDAKMPAKVTEVLLNEDKILIGLDVFPAPTGKRTAHRPRGGR